MKVIIETPEKCIYADGQTIIKTGTAEALDWEVQILETLSRVHGVPHIRGFTTTMGGSRRTLIMDLLPGEALKAPKGPVFQQVLNVLAAVYEAGIVHMRVTPENVFYGDGIISLIGFSKASILESNPMELFNKSPDMTGYVDSPFKLRGPLTKPEGCVSSLIQKVMA